MAGDQLNTFSLLCDKCPFNMVCANVTKSFNDLGVLQFAGCVYVQRPMAIISFRGPCATLLFHCRSLLTCTSRVDSKFLSTMCPFPWKDPDPRVRMAASYPSTFVRLSKAGVRFGIHNLKRRHQDTTRGHLFDPPPFECCCLFFLRARPSSYFAELYKKDGLGSNGLASWAPWKIDGSFFAQGKSFFSWFCLETKRQPVILRRGGGI